MRKNKFISIFCSAVMAFSLTACGTNTTEGVPVASATPETTSTPEPTPAAPAIKVQGSWLINQNFHTLVEGEDTFRFAEATDVAGVSAIPVSILGIQVVSGMNYVYLCGIVGEDNTTTWGIAKVYEDLEGNRQLISLSELDLDKLNIITSDAPAGQVVGGIEFTAEENNVAVIDENLALELDKAMSMYEAEILKPVVLLASNATDTEHLMLCREFDESGKAINYRVLTISRPGDVDETTTPEDAEFKVTDDRILDVISYLSNPVREEETVDDSTAIKEDAEQANQEETAPESPAETTEQTEKVEN